MVPDGNCGFCGCGKVETALPGKVHKLQFVPVPRPYTPSILVRAGRMGAEHAGMTIIMPVSNSGNPTDALQCQVLEQRQVLVILVVELNLVVRTVMPV